SLHPPPPTSLLFPYTTLFRSKDDSRNPHRKTLIIVSDLLQHTTIFSHYRGGTYEQFLRSGARLLRADLRGWDVRVLYLQRYGKRSEEHTSELQSLRHLVCRLL